MSGSDLSRVAGRVADLSKWLSAGDVTNVVQSGNTLSFQVSVAQADSDAAAADLKAALSG